MSFGSSVFRALYGCDWHDSCRQQVVVPVERVAGAVTDHPDRFGDGEKSRSWNWHGQFRERTRKCILHNLTQAAS
jgi:hypothetical protein